MRTFADDLREARDAAGSPALAGIMATGIAAGDAPEASADPVEARLADLERRIVPTQSAGAAADNPRVRCDYCPRVQQADMMVAVAPERYACDVCMWRMRSSDQQPR